MTIFIFMALIAICLPFLSKLIKPKNKRDIYHWGLGADCCYFYSSPFSVHHQCITISGYQTVLDEKCPIRYAIVKINWRGKRTIFAQELVYGGSNNCPYSFQLLMDRVPNGDHYRIEVYNCFNMSYGGFKVIGSLEKGSCRYPKAQ